MPVHIASTNEGSYAARLIGVSSYTHCLADAASTQAAVLQHTHSVMRLHQAWHG